MHDDKSPAENGSTKTTALLRVSKVIYEEVEKFAQDAKITLRDAADQIYFNKLASVIDPHALTDTDENLTPFKLAVKHVMNPRAIDALIKTARLDLLRVQTDIARKRLDFMEHPPATVRYEDRVVFACPACTATFDSADGAMRHFNIAHPTPTNKAIGHTCPYCHTEMSFPTTGALRDHIGAYHKELFKAENKPVINPPPSPIPPLEVKTIEVKLFGCYCGGSWKTDIERATHAARCPWLANYVKVNAPRVV